MNITLCTHIWTKYIALIQVINYLLGISVNEKIVQKNRKLSATEIN